MAFGSTALEEQDGRTFGSQLVQMFVCVSVFNTLVLSAAGKS